MRLLVCGSRTWNDIPRTDAALDAAHLERKITLLIEGGQATRDKQRQIIYGADWLAKQWAYAHGIPAATFRADWSIGKRAGPERNQRMIDMGKPDRVLAFPNGPAGERSGTADMVRRAIAAGLPVWRPYGN